MNEFAPPPAYRLNLRLVLMSFLIWIGAGVVHVGDGFLQARRAMGTNDAVQPAVQARARSSRASVRGEKSAVYPPSPSVKSMTHSEPWLCTSAKTTLRGSFSSPGLRSQVDDTWTAACLLSGFLPLKPTAVVHSQSKTTLESPSQCEQLTRMSCHQPYGCYESHVQLTTYEKFHKVSDNIDIIKFIERSEVVTMESAMTSSPEPPSMTIWMEKAVELVIPKKKKRGIFRNIFSRNNEKIIVKKFPPKQERGQ
ncbi:hypothetical protein MRX96_019571 [Rhipicephalus microplus]